MSIQRDLRELSRVVTEGDLTRAERLIDRIDDNMHDPRFIDDWHRILRLNHGSETECEEFVKQVDALILKTRGKRIRTVPQEPEEFG